jgi:hypothetical protein
MKEPRCAGLSEAKASRTQDVDWGFLLNTTLLTIGVITQPYYIMNVFSSCYIQ